jgi:hypothetical protein
MKRYARKMEPEELRQLLELRRSSASSRHKNKKKYSRKSMKRNRHEV